MTKSPLVERPAPFEARTYIREELASGWALSKALRSLTLDHGEITSPLPASADNRAPVTFRTGIVPSFGIESWVTNHVVRLLAPGSGRVALFEDQMARLGDPSLERETLPYIILDQTIVYVLREGASSEEILDAFRGAASYMMVGVILDHPPIELSRNLTPDQSWSTGLVDCTTELLIGAYDNDGILIWRPNTNRNDID